MGLSIHYSGWLRNESLLEELISETEDICKSLGWPYNIIREPNPEQINGICFSPENCEPVFLTFLSGGRLCSLVNLMNKDIYDGNVLDKELMFTASTKTQYAGMDAHIAVIKLLRYYKEKYFENFELSDEGNYWETNDVKELELQFARYNFIVNSVTEALSKMPKIEGESATSLADRIEEMFKKKFGDEENL